MTHFHVHVENDEPPKPREVGALTLTRDAGLHEAQIEMASRTNTKRRAHLDPCDGPCFGKRSG